MAVLTWLYQFLPISSTLRFCLSKAWISLIFFFHPVTVSFFIAFLFSHLFFLFYLNRFIYFFFGFLFFCFYLAFRHLLLPKSFSSYVYLFMLCSLHLFYLKWPRLFLSFFSFILSQSFLSSFFFSFDIHCYFLFPSFLLTLFFILYKIFSLFLKLFLLSFFFFILSYFI